jgi:hypothetical protein
VLEGQPPQGGGTFSRPRRNAADFAREPTGRLSLPRCDPSVSLLTPQRGGSAFSPKEFTIRVYVTVPVPTADKILASGFWDMRPDCGLEGTHLATAPLGANDGPEGDVTLCLDVPEPLFKEYEVVVEGEGGDRWGILPADRLNQLPPPAIYDHTFAGSSRRDLVTLIRQGVQSGEPGSARPGAGRTLGNAGRPISAATEKTLGGPRRVSI